MNLFNSSRSILVFILIIFLIFSLSLNQGQYCSHKIFCNQKILKSISDSNLFQNDFKQFVDLVLKVPVQQALKSFQTESIQKFISNNFMSSQSILQPINLTDYVQKPAKFSKIKSLYLRTFAYDLNRRWNQLARQINLNFSSLSTTCLIDCSTFLQLTHNHTIIIPGGRFKQTYYWDSYWIIKGLIASDMLITAELLVRNFLQIVNFYGYVPNGFRKYYLNRSQPPFLTLMVKDVVEALYMKGDREKAEKLQQDAFGLLVKQHDYWQMYKSKTVIVKNQIFKLNVYYANSTTPRPQSYRQDIKQLQNITDFDQRARIFRAFSSIAQSGWDFSSRWFKDPMNKFSTNMNQIVPTDLNTLLAINEGYLAKLAEKYKRIDLQQYFIKRMKERKQYFVLIKLADGRYPDLKPNSTFSSVYPSDFYPYLLFPEQISLTKFFSSLVNPVSSTIPTTQQWDSPNVWAPNNWIIHQILPRNTAFKFAQQWVSTVYCGWKKNGLIYQKYRNDKFGMRGQGGEYQVQTGFGWTNGLVMYYLMLYSEELIVPTMEQCQG